jgi:hypothetical protein
MVTKNEGVGAQAWREKASYEYVLALPREKLAAEFMRRNPEFDAAWSAWLSRQSAKGTMLAVKVQRLRNRDPQAERWGLLTFPFRRKRHNP